LSWPVPIRAKNLPQRVDCEGGKRNGNGTLAHAVLVVS
jgi:hypothetical protein